MQLDHKSHLIENLEQALKETTEAKVSLNQEREDLYQASVITKKRQDDLDSQLQKCKEAVVDLTAERDNLVLMTISKAEKSSKRSLYILRSLIWNCLVQ